MPITRTYDGNRGLLRMATLEHLLDVIPTAVSLWDIDVRNVYANRHAYETWFGREPEELRGMHSSELLGPELYELHAPYQRKCLAGESQIFERDLTDATGRVRHAQIEYHPYRQDGVVVGLITIITDITERVHAEREAGDVAVELAAMAERLRIEEHAHANVLQNLFAAQLKLEAVQRAAESVPPGMDEAIVIIDQAIDELRHITAPDPDGDPSAGTPLPVGES